MVSALLGKGFIFKRRKLDPVKIAQIKDTNWIEALPIGPTTPKENKLMIDWIVADSRIWSRLRYVSEGGDLAPCETFKTVHPKIVHVIWIYIFEELLANPPKR